MIIATTVAIGHMKNLEINELKSSHEQQDRWRKEIEEQEKRNRPSIEEINRHLT